MIKGMSKGQAAKLVAKHKLQERAAKANAKNDNERLEGNFKKLDKLFKISHGSTGGDIA